MLYRPIRHDDASVGVADISVEHRLSVTEQQVVLLSWKDSLASACRPRRMSRAISYVFGILDNNALADSRLEALRVFCVRYRHGGATAGSVRHVDVDLDIQTLSSAIELLECHVGGATCRHARDSRCPVALTSPSLKSV